MISTENILYFAILALAVTAFLLCSALCRSFIALALLPNRAEERSSHAGSVPRAGGLAILISFFAAGLAGLWLNGATWTGDHAVLVATAVLMGAVGLMDDIAEVSAGVKFLAQIVLATALVVLAGPIDTLPLPIAGETALGVLAIPVSVLWIVAFVNAFNFMDGLNGMAAGTALIALIAMALAAIMAGQSSLFILCLVMAFVQLGFFVHNYPHGRIFMGDAGSLGTGFLLAGIAVVASQGDGGAPGIPAVFLPLIFLPFLLDVTITLGKRILGGKPIYKAHKEHFYQRLHQAGWSHASVARLYMLAVAICAVSGWAIARLPGPVEWMGVLALAIVMLIGAYACGGAIRRSRAGAEASERDEASEGAADLPANAE